MKNYSRLARQALLTLAAIASGTALAFTPVQQPPETSTVPGNLLFALSVEYPTGLQASYDTANYDAALTYDGYFDNRKCYTYNSTTELFSPTSKQNEDTNKTCPTSPSNNQWSGNLLNWLTMTNLDQFRAVMTGGTRDTVSQLSTTQGGNQNGDSSTNTILIRSFSDRDEYHVTKTLPNTAALPSTYRSKSVRSGGYGSKFMVRTSGSSGWPGTGDQRKSCAASTKPSGIECIHIRVEVCKTVAGVSMEANCKGYSGSSKPEGLVQQYANQLRYGAFGYLNDDERSRNGGVLRAAMKSVGKDKALGDGTTASNTNKEWDETTGIQSVNPDPTDASASGVSKSGVINYLNQFGYAAGYKTLDPVSELYYAALRYLRGLALPSDYTNNLNDTRKDGFPVITGNAILRGGERDPLINTCQRNFLLTLGDIYTHSDKDISDGEFSASGLWSQITSMEGSTNWTGGATDGGPYIAGLAYWAHTNDIRSDLTGEQTVETYIVDVLEKYNGASTGTHSQRTLNASRTKTQYWLAAKYGGYDKEKAAAAGNRLNPNVDRTSWDRDALNTNGYNVPDNWFAGNSPDALRAGLSSAFADIAAKAQVGASAAASTSSSRQTEGTRIIYTGYDSRTWSGSLTSCRWKESTTFEEAKSRLPYREECEDPAHANHEHVEYWQAAKWLDTSATDSQYTSKLDHTNRKILTAYHADATSALVTGQAFQWSALTAAQKAIFTAGTPDETADDLAAADANGEETNEIRLLNFLRGDRSQEQIKFRNRHGATLLGDIVHSSATQVMGPSYPYDLSNFSNHAQYRDTQRNRPSVIYAGANDGMLHAFSGSTGKELFAYAPQAVFHNLPKLGELAFSHRYYVDSTPMAGDIETGANGLGNWKTILVGGLGAGGKGYYALDITNQSTMATATESSLAATLPYWEFTSEQNADMGYSFNEPSVHPVTRRFMQIAKVADATVETGAWRVIVGNGYGSTNGKAVLFMLNATNGQVATSFTVDTPAADAPQNGLSTPTPVDTDGDGLVDTIYAGDLKGDMHKFQFSRLSDGNYVRATPGETGAAWRYLGKVFASGEPIVSAPSLSLSCSGNGINVAFGTGKLNESGDYTDNASRSFFAFDDINSSTSLLVSDSDLAPITLGTPTTLATGETVHTWTAPNMTDKKGWKVTLTGGERVLGNSLRPANSTEILFATTRPGGDVCVAGGSSFVMGINTCKGTSTGLVVNGVEVGGLATDITGENKIGTTYQNENGEIKVTDSGKGTPDFTVKSSVAPKGRYTWRELLTK